jgi:hypothetical protein
MTLTATRSPVIRFFPTTTVPLDPEPSLFPKMYGPIVGFVCLTFGCCRGVTTVRSTLGFLGVKSTLSRRGIGPGFLGDIFIRVRRGVTGDTLNDGLDFGVDPVVTAGSSTRRTRRKVGDLASPPVCCLPKSSMLVRKKISGDILIMGERSCTGDSGVFAGEHSMSPKSVGVLGLPPAERDRPPEKELSIVIMDALEWRDAPPSLWDPLPGPDPGASMCSMLWLDSGVSD